MAKLHIAPTIAIDENELEETFVQSAGPGGQNVNKVATAVQLRFDVTHSSLPEALRSRLVLLAGKRMSKEGVLVITARRHRTQDRNRREARGRLVELIRNASVVAAPRHATKLPRAAKRRRSEAKMKRSALKQMRRTPEET